MPDAAFLKISGAKLELSKHMASFLTTIDAFVKSISLQKCIPPECHSNFSFSDLLEPKQSQLPPPAFSAIFSDDNERTRR